MVGVEQDVGAGRQRQQARIVDDHEGHHQRAGQNGDVGGDAAGHHDHPRHLLRRHAQQLRRKELARHHDAAAALRRLRPVAGDVVQQPGDQIAHVVRLLAHEADGARLEAAQIAVRHLQHGAGDRGALLDQALDAVGESGILQDQQVRGEDQRRHVGEPLTDVRLHLLQLLFGNAQRPAKVLHGQVGGKLGIGQRLVLTFPVHAQAGAARKSARGDLALERGLHVQRQELLAFARQRAGAEQQPGVLDGAGELRRDGAQPLHVHAREAAVLAPLYHQHADAGDAAGQRHRQKTLELLFPEVGHVAIEGAVAGDRLLDVAQLLERGAGEPLAQLQTHLTPQVAVQPVGGGHGELPIGGVVQVDGTHVGAHVLGDHPRRPVEEGTQIHRLMKQRAEFVDVAD